MQCRPAGERAAPRPLLTSLRKTEGIASPGVCRQDLHKVSQVKATCLGFSSLILNFNYTPVIFVHRISAKLLLQGPLTVVPEGTEITQS